MPELPDVEVSRQYLDATCLHREIVRLSLRESRILDGLSAPTLRRWLRGTQLTSTRRHGKWLYAELEDGRWWRVHFGMSGRLKAFDSDGPPEHTLLLLTFADGRALAYVCPRKLGHVGITKDPAAHVEAEGLGPDALEPDLRGFRELLAGRRGGIKSALMDQKLIAGLGNLYSDEILFQAGLHPERGVPGLSEEEVSTLHRRLRRILPKAVEYRAEVERMPGTWLLPHRGEEGAPCPRCDGSLRRATVAGRSSWFCDRHQNE